jgi:hypothetical protein
MVVAPRRMIDSFLSIPDAESLSLYRMVSKLACVWSRVSFTSNARDPYRDVSADFAKYGVQMTVGLGGKVTHFVK